MVFAPVRRLNVVNHTSVTKFNPGNRPEVHHMLHLVEIRIFR